MMIHPSGREAPLAGTIDPHLERPLPKLGRGISSVGIRPRFLRPPPPRDFLARLPTSSAPPPVDLLPKHSKAPPSAPAGVPRLPDGLGSVAFRLARPFPDAVAAMKYNVYLEDDGRGLGLPPRDTIDSTAYHREDCGLTMCGGGGGPWPRRLMMPTAKAATAASVGPNRGGSCGSAFVPCIEGRGNSSRRIEGGGIHRLDHVMGTSLGGAAADPANAKAKTEMCSYYDGVRADSCPFGGKCAFAHGPSELRRPRLFDLAEGFPEREDAELFLKTYRTRPCLEFVSTGACPFGPRCEGIHDPRVGGCIPSWLMFMQKESPRFTTKCQVDSLYRQRIMSLYNGNPFGKEFIGDWESCYGMICNLKRGKDPPSFTGRTDADPTAAPREGCHKLTERQRLEIVLAMMREWTAERDARVNYRDTHIIYGETCMLLQSRDFYVRRGGGGRRDSGERPDAEIVVVREGPPPERESAAFRRVAARMILLDPTRNRTVHDALGVWFDIPDGEVMVCTPEEAAKIKKLAARRMKNNIKQKRKCLLRREGQRIVHQRHARKLEDEASGAKDEGPNGDGVRAPEISSFRAHAQSPSLEDPFYIVRPHDRDASRLAASVLRHRLQVLKAGPGAPDGVAELAAVELHLRATFESQRERWNAMDSWPVNSGREEVDDDTLNPLAEAPYRFPAAFSANSKGLETCGEGLSKRPGSVVGEKHKFTHTIWESFISTMESELASTLTDRSAAMDNQRPSICKQLSKGQSLLNEESPTLPAISTKLPAASSFSEESSHPRNNSERCWDESFLGGAESSVCAWGEWEEMSKCFGANLMLSCPEVQPHEDHFGTLLSFEEGARMSVYM